MQKNIFKAKKQRKTLCGIHKHFVQTPITYCTKSAKYNDFIEINLIIKFISYAKKNCVKLLNQFLEYEKKQYTSV